MNATHAPIAVAIVHAESPNDRLAAARRLLAVFDPCESDPEMPDFAPVVAVCLDAFIANPGRMNARALIAALEAFYEMG